jgi:hypothetical protein
MNDEEEIHLQFVKRIDNRLITSVDDGFFWLCTGLEKEKIWSGLIDLLSTIQQHVLVKVERVNKTTQNALDEPLFAMFGPLTSIHGYLYMIHEEMYYAFMKVRCIYEMYI